MAQASGAAPSSGVLPTQSCHCRRFPSSIPLALTLNSARLTSISSRVMLLVCCRLWSCGKVGWGGEVAGTVSLTVAKEATIQPRHTLVTCTHTHI